MKRGLIYIHGKGGNASEADHYRMLFADYDVTGLDYHSETPWEAKEEFIQFFDAYKQEHDTIVLIANSIGAFFAMHALNDKKIEKAYFISPILNMEKLIMDMILWAGTTQQELAEKGTIETNFGETLSIEYLDWVRSHRISWNIPTKILYGENDNLQSYETIKSFGAEHNAEITVMQNGEHWFHTEEQMRFLDDWVKQ